MRKYYFFGLQTCFMLLAITTPATTLHVSQDSPSPKPPYTDWLSAATNIQDAVDAAQAGDTVLVMGGVYDTGGRAVVGTMTNRVAIDKAIRVESLMGPEVTVIRGYQVPGRTNGNGAIRCVYLTNGAVLSGFTLTNGDTRTDGDFILEQSGGGLWCESTNALVTNCVVTGNSAKYGAGAAGGTLNNCTLTGNLALNEGGGAAWGTLNHCTVTGNSSYSGGGTTWSTLNHSTLSGNSAHRYGGGAYRGTLNNCTLTGNSAEYGGGAYMGTLYTCTVTSNSAILGGGARSSTLNNCTVTRNSASHGGGAADSTLNNCTLTGNSATVSGGGAAVGTLNNCTVTGNSANSYGGGASLCALTNCTLTGNSATNSGGGADGGTLENCTLTGNSATYGGGASGSTLNNCALTGNSAYLGGGAHYSTLNTCIVTDNSVTDGGGAFQSTLNNCTLTGNSASYRGGGAFQSTLTNCVLTGNSARGGGGAFDSTLNNCSLTGNSAEVHGGGASWSTLNNCTLYGNSATDGGGAFQSTLNNCIVYFNTAPNGPNYGPTSTLNFCCTTPVPSTGVGNITNEPDFVNPADGDFRLQSNSPCINSGNNSYVTTTTDLEGNQRLALGTVDIGAYEYQGGGSAISYAWLQQYDLPKDGSVDLTDDDDDGLSTSQEWVAGTNPTNAASSLRLTIIFNSPDADVQVTLSGFTARLYTLQRCTNLTASSVWTTVPGQMDVLGNGDVLTLTDTNPPAPAFYRVSVRFR